MTPETLYKIRSFVSGYRRKAQISADNSRLNGYKQIALEHENEVAFADQILKELADEHGEPL